MRDTAELNMSKNKTATRFMFLCAGIITAAWATNIPFVKDSLNISDGVIGGLLLCLGAGALMGMPLAGIGAGKYGCKTVLTMSVLGFSALFMGIPFVGNIYVLACVLLAFGMMIGITDCAMNIQAVEIEKNAKSPLMSGFHGFYSLGGLAGALFMTFQLTLNVQVVVATIVTSILIITMLIFSRSGLLGKISGDDGPMWILPRGVVILIGLVCCILFLAEGTVLDWSGIFLIEFRQIPLSIAGLGIAFFSIAMTAARLTGDKVVSRFGPRAVMNLGILIAIAGFLLTLHVSAWPFALFGYMLIGLGCANVVPIMFSATSKQSVMPQAMAVTAVSTLGYAGVLAGPALVGFSADVLSLPISLHLIVALLVIASLLSNKIKV